MDALPNVILYRHNKFRPLAIVPRSFIMFYELTLVFSGGFTYIVNDEKHELKTGDAILIKYGDMRERLAVKEPTNYVSFNFVLTQVPIKREADLFTKPVLATNPPEIPGYLQELLSLPTYLPKIVDNNIKLLVTAADSLNEISMHNVHTSLIMLNILRIIKDKITNPPVSELVQKIENYLITHFNEQITLSDIEHAMFFSKTHCHMVFKKEKGITIIDYLNNFRIKKAKELLIEGVYSLEEIAEQTGYTSYNYFARVFKKITSYTPKEYRRLLN